MKNNVDILVIGGGQSGLVMAYHLSKQPYTFQILERHQRVGDSWRLRYDSLKLFSPRAFSALPGFKVSGDTDSFATKNEIADYLESYAKHFELPVATGTGVRKLERTADGFSATTDDAEAIISRAVIIATGAFEEPSIPPFSKQLGPSVQQFSPTTYRNPNQISRGTILVVGDGATGRQIALELSETHRVILAHGKNPASVPISSSAKITFGGWNSLGYHGRPDSQLWAGIS